MVIHTSVFEMLLPPVECGALSPGSRLLGHQVDDHPGVVHIHVSIGVTQDGLERLHAKPKGALKLLQGGIRPG